MTPAPEAGKPGRAGNAAAVESLYPFLYAGESDLDAVMKEVRQSTVAKAAEIAALRREVCARDATRLLGDNLAVVDTGSGEEEVSVAFVPAQVGDTILVHAGEAIAVVTS